MIAQDLAGLVEVKPFRPFRITASDGRTFVARHPDAIAIYRARITFPAEHQDEEGWTLLEHLSLNHIVRVEELPRGD